MCVCLSLRKRFKVETIQFCMLSWGSPQWLSSMRIYCLDLPAWKLSLREKEKERCTYLRYTYKFLVLLPLCHHHQQLNSGQNPDFSHMLSSSSPTLFSSWMNIHAFPSNIIITYFGSRNNIAIENVLFSTKLSLLLLFSFVINKWHPFLISILSIYTDTHFLFITYFLYMYYVMLFTLRKFHEKENERFK